MAGAEHDRCHETVLQLKHQLECKNLANIMYVICMERHKCQVERALLQQLYEKQTQGLQNRLTEKTTKVPTYLPSIYFFLIEPTLEASMYLHTLFRSYRGRKRNLRKKSKIYI